MYLIIITLLINQSKQQEQDDLVKSCESQTCHYDSCFGCLSNICCDYNEASCTRSVKWIKQTFGKEIKHKTSLDELVTYEELEVENVTLLNATNYAFRKYDRCGVPSYCGDQQVKGSSGKFIFNQTLANTTQGEYCTWFFQGEEGPFFIVKIQIGIIPTTPEMYMGFCVDIFQDTNAPCSFQILQREIFYPNFNKAGAIQAPFRLSIQFGNNLNLQLDQISITIVSLKYQNREQAEMLFLYFVGFLTFLILLIIFLVLVKCLLIRIFGRRILRWIDPEPLVPTRFDSRKYLKFLHTTKILQIIQPSQIKFDQIICSYCLEPLENAVVYEMFCGHAFHEKCCMEHITTQNGIDQCPICKINLTEQSKNSFSTQDTSS